MYIFSLRNVIGIVAAVTMDVLSAVSIIFDGHGCRSCPTTSRVSFASERALEIEHVLLTYFRTDFIAGHSELRDRGRSTNFVAKCKSANRVALLDQTNELHLFVGP